MSGGNDPVGSPAILRVSPSKDAGHRRTGHLCDGLVPAALLDDALRDVGVFSHGD